jgi:hypothetical protein
MRKITYQGETVILVGTTALDLTDYEDIKVSVYDRRGDVVLRAARVGGGLWDNTLFRDTDTDEFEVIIHKSVSADMEVGMYTVECETIFNDLDWATAVYDKSRTEEFFHSHARI